VVTERQWEIFTKALGEPELMDPKYATNNLRSMARGELIPLVARLLKKHPDRAARDDLRRGRAAVRAHPDAVRPLPRRAPQRRRHGGPHASRRHGDEGPALPIQFGDVRLPLRSPLPTPGQHNSEILGHP
jgi:crotonobetainyl-CoA:carnitine CoA-transferase CaiB-like acyl-CoA transferase